MWYCAYYMKWIDPTSLCHTDASSDQQCLIACFYLCFCARLRRLRTIVLHLTTDIAPPVYTYINIAPPGYMYINGAPSHVCVSMCENCTATDAITRIVLLPTVHMQTRIWTPPLLVCTNHEIAPTCVWLALPYDGPCVHQLQSVNTQTFAYFPQRNINAP